MNLYISLLKGKYINLILVPLVIAIMHNKNFPCNRLVKNKIAVFNLYIICGTFDFPICCKCQTNVVWLIFSFAFSQVVGMHRYH